MWFILKIKKFYGKREKKTSIKLAYKKKKKKFREIGGKLKFSLQKYEPISIWK